MLFAPVSKNASRLIMLTGLPLVKYIWRPLIGWLAFLPALHSQFVNYQTHATYMEQSQPDVQIFWHWTSTYTWQKNMDLHWDSKFFCIKSAKSSNLYIKKSEKALRIKKPEVVTSESQIYPYKPKRLYSSWNCPCKQSFRTLSRVPLRRWSR